MRNQLLVRDASKYLQMPVTKTQHVTERTPARALPPSCNRTAPVVLIVPLVPLVLPVLQVIRIVIVLVLLVIVAAHY